MHPFIPEEIVVTILTNLPADSLARFKCVSKQWCRLISESNTVKRKLFTKSVSISNEEVSIQSIDPTTLEVEDMDVPWEAKQTGFYGSCNGLFLVQSGDDLFLWNPFIHYHQKILSYKDLSRYRMFGGICFDSIKKEYKVVVYLRLIFKGGREFAMVGSPTEKSWTHFDFPYSSVKPGPTLNNHVHWLVYKRDSRPSLIVYFDTKTGKFVELLSPRRNYYIHGFGVLDGCLCLSCSEDLSDYPVLVMAMKVYGVRESWTVLFKIEHLCCPECLVPFFYLDEKKSEILMRLKLVVEDYIYVYDISSNSEIDVVTVNYLRGEIVYEETLVRPIGYGWEELDSRGEAYYVEKFVSSSQRTMKKDRNGDWYAEDESEEDSQERVME